MPLPTLPSAILSSAFVDGLVVNAVKLYTVYSQAINNLITWGDSIGQGFIGEYIGSDSFTLSSTAVFVPAANHGVVFTLTEQRRIRVDTKAVFSGTGTAGFYHTYAFVTTGTTPSALGTIVGDTRQGRAYMGATTGAIAGYDFGSVLLAAGSYIAYPGMQRAAGGLATDTSTQQYTLVTDLGST